MTDLPPSHLPVGCLAAVFNDCTSSYKFLMMRAILDLAQTASTIKMNDVALRSLSYAWYTINFYKLSYGPSDSMEKWIEKLGSQLSNKDYEFLISDQSYHKIYPALKELIKEGIQSEIIKQTIEDFKKYVPYRILTPWFANELRGKADHKKNSEILKLSQDQSKKPLYRLEQRSDDLYLHLDLEWQQYLCHNKEFLEGWWKWKFISFLQIKNPTVLAIANKLQPPINREMASVKKLFKDYFNASSSKPKCFYSGATLTTIHHDHFLPWSFLGSDILFNFVPANETVNYSKSNCIPSERYLRDLSDFQFDIFSWMKKTENRNIEEYIGILQLPYDPSERLFEEKMMLYYKPLYLTAKNQRFTMDWVWERRTNN